MPTTPTYLLPYPAAGDPADVPTDMQELADRLETVLPTVGATLVTALPGSPTDGQEVILVDSLTAPTYSWRLRYSSGISDASKWLFVGGIPATVLVATAESTSTTASFVDLATVGPAFTVPRAGIYLVEATVYLHHLQSRCRLALNGTPTGPEWSGGAAMATQPLVSGSPTLELTVGASGVVKIMYSSQAGAPSFSNRLLRVTPKRVA